MRAFILYKDGGLGLRGKKKGMRGGTDERRSEKMTG